MNPRFKLNVALVRSNLPCVRAQHSERGSRPSVVVLVWLVGRCFCIFETAIEHTSHTGSRRRPPFYFNRQQQSASHSL